MASDSRASRRQDPACNPGGHQSSPDFGADCLEKAGNLNEAAGRLRAISGRETSWLDGMIALLPLCNELIGQLGEEGFGLLAKKFEHLRIYGPMLMRIESGIRSGTIRYPRIDRSSSQRPRKTADARSRATCE